MEYECKLNAFFGGHEMGGICQYNRRRFSAQTLMHVIHTHPRLVFRGEVCENPFYIPAEMNQGERGEMGDAVRRLLESMAENTRLRRGLAVETEARRRAEQAALAGQTALMAAHEFHHPLEAVTNNFFLLQQEELPPRAGKWLDDMGDALERMCQITLRARDGLRLPENDGDIARMH